MDGKQEHVLKSIDDYIVVKRYVLYGERLNQPYPNEPYLWSDYANRNNNQGSVSITNLTRP